MFLVDTAKPRLSESDRQERRVFCVIEDAYQNIETARAACDGKFTIAGTTIEFGSDVDWVTSPFPADIEWQIEWHKFYYGLDLAHAFAVTGDPRFSRTWINLVRSFIGQVPVDFMSPDVLARRVQNWVYAKQIFAASGSFTGFSEEFEGSFLASIEEQTEFLFDNLTPERNHRTLELYALFIVALALPQLDEGSIILRFAMHELTENLLTDIRPDGVHREQSTHYHCTVLRSFLGAKENARRFGLQFPPEFDERLVKACEFAMHFHRPDGHIPALSDADTGSYLELLYLAGKLFDRDDFLYVATKGNEGVQPAARNVDFRNGGYFIQRSGWENMDERFLIFDCGPIGDGGHGHYDLLNIELAASGQPLIVDGGRYTYAEDADFNWRHYFKGTAAHNTVIVDGKDQTSYRRGKPKGEIARGEFIERISLPKLDVLCGRAFSPNYDAIHTRRIFFISGKYWLIVDSLKAEIPHHYDLRYHLSPAAWNHCQILTNAENSVVRTPDLALLFESRFAPSIKAGWFAPQYGNKFRAPCVSVVADGEASNDFYSLIVPLDIRCDLPSFEVMKLGASTKVAIHQDENLTETLSWNLGEGHLRNIEFEVT